MEASALPSRLSANRAPFSAAFLRLRSDDQLVALFRAGSDDAFRAIHDRYRARLLAYTRQMLRGAVTDPEDALQDVFMRAYRALRASDRPVMLRAWLYRIAHNRCIDELRRPCPLPTELAADAEPAFGAPGATREPAAVAERSAELARLVADVRTLPSQQRSALLMRELQGLSYEELASALAISVPAVKSLLLRARTGLIDIAVARETPCLEIRGELVGAADRGVRISGRARRHCADCENCDAYRGEMKRLRQGFAALSPSGPLGQLGLLFGIGGGGGAAAAGGGGAFAAGGTFAGVTAAKIAVAVCCAALITTAGRAVIEPSAPPAPPAQTATGPPSVAQPIRLSVAEPVAAGAPGTAAPAASGAQQSGGTSFASGAIGGGPVTGGAATAATGSTGATGASGPTGTPNGGTTTVTAGATGATGAAGAGALNGIGGSGATTAATDGSGATSPAGATGATGDTATTAAGDGRFDSGKTTLATGAVGAIGASAAGRSGAAQAPSATMATAAAPAGGS